MMTKRTALMLGLAAVFSAVVSVGCESKPRRIAHEVTVRLDQAAWASAGGVGDFEVDVVATNRGEELRGYPVSRYFNAGDPLRRDIRPKTFRFTPTQTAPQTIRRNDPVWQDWLAESSDLFVIANLGRVESDAARRSVLPILSGTWVDNKIDIEIQPSGISVKSERIEAK